MLDLTFPMLNERQRKQYIQQKGLFDTGRCGQRQDDRYS